MNALKEKVSDQLSRLFADSPNSSASSPSSPPSPSPARNRKARPYTNEEESLSPYFSFSMPSFSFSGSKSNKHQTGLKSVQSLPVKCNSKVSQKQGENSVKFHECYTEIENGGFQNFYEDDKEHTGVCANKLTVNTRHVNEDGAPGTNSSDSDVFEEARDHETPQKLLPEHLSDSAFISLELYEFLQSSLPNIVKGCQWVLVYSTLKHGISLRTLIRKSADIPGPCLLVVGDKQGAVFGGLLDGPLNPTPKRKYQGTNQTFVFTTIYGEPRLFRPTGANRYYYLCLNELLAFGGGGSFALCLDGDLLNGTSGPCETFGNLCLAHASEFELKNVELWGFMHSSRYLT